MSLLKPKIKRNTWSQERRARNSANTIPCGLPGEKNPGVKSQAHLERIARRKVSRNARKQQGQANTFADNQAKIASALVSSV